MRIAQITDSHVMAQGVRWKGRVDTGAALRDAVAAVNGFAPDLVVHSGDLVEDGDPAQYEVAVEALSALRAPLRLLPGNHDSRDAMRAAFPDQGWRDGAFLDFIEIVAPKAGGEALTVVGLDSVVPGKTAGAFTAEAGARLAARLRETQEAPLLVFMHHPPCPMGLPFMDAFPFEGGEELARALAGRDVLRIACGHVHAEVDRHWSGMLVSAAPAISAHLPIDQPPFTGAASDPAPVYTIEPLRIRLFDWDGAGLSVKTVNAEPAQGPFPLSGG